MNIAGLCLNNRVVTLVLAGVMLVGGLSSYQSMSRLEDPEFTIKDALVVTPYPGASAREVEEEVSDEIELAVQKLGQVDELESRSERGLSTVTVSIKTKYDKDTLPQVWDELRRKVNDAQGNLPPGAGPSTVVDDFGDVYGIFAVVYGDEYTYAEKKRYVDFLRRELLLIDDVAKIETYGERVEAVYVELSRERMAQLGISEDVIIGELRQKNLVADSGRIKVGEEFIAVEPSGTIGAVEQFESLLLSGASQKQIYLRDVASVRRGYLEPQSHAIRYDGHEAIGFGISTATGGNVVTMGEALKARMRELQSQLPLGMEFGAVSIQSDAVTTSIANFVNSLLQAVAIVIVVLLFFMGVRSGLLIGFVLVLTIAGSFIFLAPMGVALERISLGALIISLGMLVDNAIVIVDGMLIKLGRGVDPEQAACEVVEQSAWPLLGATVIAILAFAAIGTSNDSTGEFCRSLYQVVLTSLLLSWVTAVTVTPVLGVMFLKGTGAEGGDSDPYAAGFYKTYRSFLRACIGFRWLTVTVVAGVFALSLWGFGFVERSFFPPSTRPQFMVDVWLPQGTHIDETLRTSASVEDYLRKSDGVTHVTSLVGKGALRFLLTLSPERPNSAYLQFLVDVEDPSVMDTLLPEIEARLAEDLPDALSYASKFQLGPGSTGKVQTRFLGPDPDVLRGLAEQAVAVIRADPDSKAIRTDWRQRVKVYRPQIAEEQANLNGIRRADVARTIQEGFQGARVGVYREGDLLLPIVLRSNQASNVDVSDLDNLQIWSHSAGRMIPLRQVVSGFDTAFEDEIIIRKNRKRTLTVFADPMTGPASKLLGRVRSDIEAIELPDGYVQEWGGEYEDSSEAQAALAGGLPFFVMIMILITVVLFNSLRLPLVIWLCVPLALIGVSTGLLLMNQPFGFMSLLGFLSLSGMLIKNAIVLIDQINLELSEGKAPMTAVLDSGVSRLRPVSMAAATTALGMIPLLADAFFVAMAVTIIFGLVFATVLTMIVVPVLYAVFFNVSD